MSSVSEHYTVGDLGKRILAVLETSGVDLATLTVDDLAPVDAFHIRGRAATEELAGLAQLGDGDHVLDVGCGIGGTARFLASRFGCRVTGIDLTEEFCVVGNMLSERVGLAARTALQPASALDLPFDDGVFDVVWTEHVQMNIEDKARFYDELVRVLRPGGQLAFHDIFAGPELIEAGLHLPVPWAEDQSISYLVDPGMVRGRLEGMGLTVLHWSEKTDESAAFFREVLERVRNEGPAPLGVHLLMGETAPVKFGNVLRNLEDERIQVVQAVLRNAG